MTEREIPEEFTGFVERDVFPTRLGIVYDDLQDDRVRAHLDAEPKHHQPMGIVHGGVYSSLVETVASVGGGLFAYRQGKTCVGVSNTTEFIRSHREGRIEAVATRTAENEHYQFWTVEITRPSDGKLIAHGTVTLRNLYFDALDVNRANGPG